MRNIPQAAVGKRVDASPELACHLQLEVGGETGNVNMAGTEKENPAGVTSAMGHAHTQCLDVPVRLWSYRGPLTLCGTQSGQRLGQKIDQPHTSQPYWEERVKSFVTKATQG